jgi:two-component system, NtrC family, response regulator HydG
MTKVLLVDDQANLRRSTAILLEQDGCVVHQAGGAAEATAILASADVDVVLTDVRMDGDADGRALLGSIKARSPDIEVVLITAFATIADAVEAIKAGAYDYLTKPLDPARLLLTVRRAAERASLAREVKHLRAQQVDGGEIIASSPQMQQVLRTVAQLAQTDSTVLITGESGTGKELIARALYTQSRRRNGKFVPINSGAMPESIMESELFGHRKGSFTGAVSDKKGLLEEAHRGVLFLDEIGDMPSSMQVRLLRFLQGGEVRRVGETQERRVDVRLVLATHRSLEAEVAAGRFRDDLYYRINVVGLVIPPLRERPEDIPPLAEHIVRRLAARHRRPVRGFTQTAMALLTAHQWAGNVRELENAIERALNLASGVLITEADLPAALTVSPDPRPRLIADDVAVDRVHLIDALDRCHWNHQRAAATLGISRTTLWRKLREFQIQA